jgi:hypothetical protein
MLMKRRKMGELKHSKRILLLTMRNVATFHEST